MRFATPVGATRPVVCEMEEVVRATEDDEDEVVEELYLEIEVEVDDAVGFMNVVVEDDGLGEDVIGATARGRVEGVAVRVNEEVVLVFETTDEVEAN